jgi:hypothetical protein
MMLDIMPDIPDIGIDANKVAKHGHYFIPPPAFEKRAVRGIMNQIENDHHARKSHEHEEADGRGRIFPGSGYKHEIGGQVEGYDNDAFDDDGIVGILRFFICLKIMAYFFIELGKEWSGFLFTEFHNTCLNNQTYQVRRPL